MPRLVSHPKTTLALIALASVTLVGWLDAQSAHALNARIVDAHATPTGGWSVYACALNANPPTPRNSTSSFLARCERLWIPPNQASQLQRSGVRLETLSAGRSFHARVFDVSETNARHWQLASADSFAVYANSPNFAP